MIDPQQSGFVWIDAQNAGAIDKFYVANRAVTELIWRVCFFAPTKDHHQYGNNTPCLKSTVETLRDVVDEETKSGWFE